MDLKKYKDKFSEYTYYLKDGKEVKHGLFKVYYENGQLEYENNWKNGELDGLCKIYYENGKIKSEYNYKDGELHGLCKRYYKDGELESERSFKNNIQIN